MRTLMPLAVFALVLMIGCSKDNATPFGLDTNGQNSEESTVFIPHFDGDDIVWSYETGLAQVFPDMSSNIVSTRDANGNSAHTHGSFPGVEFSGTQNNGGLHGTATANLGPFTFTLETECVTVEENVAMYGGLITEVAGPPGFPFGVDDYVYFRVIDNGQGNNAPADQFTGSIKFQYSSKCGDWSPSHPTWTAPDFNIPEPGSVKVNN